MTRSEHNPSRRALLGAAVALPWAMPGRAPPPGFTRSPSPSPRDGEDEWQSALAAFRAAQAEVARVEAASAGCSFEEEEAWLPAHDAACEAMEGALGRVLRLAAPDLGALAVKMELLFAQAIEPGAVEDFARHAILADSRRLLIPQS